MLVSRRVSVFGIYLCTDLISLYLLFVDHAHLSIYPYFQCFSIHTFAAHLRLKKSTHSIFTKGLCVNVAEKPKDWCKQWVTSTCWTGKKNVHWWPPEVLQLMGVSFKKITCQQVFCPKRKGSSEPVFHVRTCCFFQGGDSAKVCGTDEFLL